MQHKKIYIQSAAQISMQQPLCEQWMDEPIIYNGGICVPSLHPNFRDYLSPMESRRWGKILKRALVTSLQTIKEAGMEPEAIMTGTGLGCFENSEQFLDAMYRDGESLLKPTYFMQSTHNTISSLIAIHTHNHGYNVTYSHGSISFDSALWDAILQLRSAEIKSALVGGFDELTPLYEIWLKRMGCLPDKEECLANGLSNEGLSNGLSNDNEGSSTEGSSNEGSSNDCLSNDGLSNECISKSNDDNKTKSSAVFGETSISTFLSDAVSEHSLCELVDEKILYKPSSDDLKRAVSSMLEMSGISTIDAVFLGVNGLRDNDRHYEPLINDLFAGVPLYHYKHLFGESFTSSGFGFYAAAHCLHKGVIPPVMRYRHEDDSNALRNILLVNQCEGKNYSFILLKSLCGE